MQVQSILKQHKKVSHMVQVPPELDEAFFCPALCNKKIQGEEEHAWSMPECL